MSFKFRRDGALFPTEVKNGELIIHVGSHLVKESFKFLTDEFELDNTEFPMCNVMCFLRNDNCYVVMRFDGTVTKFNKNMEVTGFSKFDKELIYQHTVMAHVGIVGHGHSDFITEHTQCTIYSVVDSGEYILECVGDPEPIEFKSQDNPLFVQDILKGSRYFPRLVKVATNLYKDDEDKYTVSGRAIKTTGYIEM